MAPKFGRRVECRFYTASGGNKMAVTVFGSPRELGSLAGHDGKPTPSTSLTYRITCIFVRQNKVFFQIIKMDFTTTMQLNVIFYSWRWGAQYVVITSLH